MKYSEALFFITDVLSLRINPKNRYRVASKISGRINWELIVQLSSKHYVLPALFIRLKDTHLLHLLPHELQDYMAYINSLNRARNKKLLVEAKAINEVLSLNYIKPIFLKGTALLSDGLYSDISERMVGDIDFLVAQDEVLKAARILTENGYKSFSDVPQDFNRMKHYPRMVHQEREFALEIHKDVIQSISDRQLNYTLINQTKRMVNGLCLPSYSNLILHNMMNMQMNDKGFLFASCNLRQQYDFTLLSQKENPGDVIRTFQHHKRILKAYLVKTNYLFHRLKTLSYSKNLWTFWVGNRCRLTIYYPRVLKIINSLIFLISRGYRDCILFIQYILKKHKRKQLAEHLLNAKWRSEYFRSIFNGIASV